MLFNTIGGAHLKNATEIVVNNSHLNFNIFAQEIIPYRAKHVRL